MSYTVKGGEYADTNFDTITDSKHVSTHDTYQEAVAMWHQLSWANVDNCHYRAVIEGSELDIKTYTYDFPMASVTSTVVLFKRRLFEAPKRGFFARLFGQNGSVSTTVILAKRKDDADAYPGQWCLPGGFLNAKSESQPGETCEKTAVREVFEETNIKINATDLEFLRPYSNPETDPRGHVVNMCYSANVNMLHTHKMKPADDIVELREFSIDEAKSMKLAFNHSEILRYAISNANIRTIYRPGNVDLQDLGSIYSGGKRIRSEIVKRIENIMLNANEAHATDYYYLFRFEKDVVAIWKANFPYGFGSNTMLLRYNPLMSLADHICYGDTEFAYTEVALPVNTYEILLDAVDYFDLEGPKLGDSYVQY